MSSYSAVYFDTTEWHDSINGLNCEYNWKECRNFTTGSGAHVWAVIEGLFGLEITISGEIKWKPNFPLSWKNKPITISGARHGDEMLTKEFTFDGSWKLNNTRSPVN